MPQSSRTRYTEAKEQVTKTSGLNLWFSRFATQTAQVVGHPYMFLVAFIIIAVWALSGPYFHYSDTWQLIINTGTTIITFLVVFLIQNTQNRDGKALHLKLDELIRSHHPASDDLIEIQKLSDEELDKLEERYAEIRKECEARREKAAQRTSAKPGAAESKNAESKTAESKAEKSKAEKSKIEESKVA